MVPAASSGDRSFHIKLIYISLTAISIMAIMLINTRRPRKRHRKIRMVVPGGFEPPSPAPKAGMIDHYTTGLCFHRYRSFI